MSVLYIMVGLPGSGKSYIANILAKETNGTVVSRDEIRFKYLKDGEDYFKHEKKVFREYVNTIQSHLDKNETVIADATHIDVFSRRKLLESISLTNEDYIVPVVIDTPFEVCKKRNAQRTGRKRVPDLTLNRLRRRFVTPEADSRTLWRQYYDILYIEGKENK